MPKMEIIMQGQQNFHESFSSLPILPRLDRLDRVLQFLEERHSLPKRLSTDFSKKVEYGDQEYTRIHELEDPRKSLSSVLEEVHHKGTLVERLAMLENRVLQLSMDILEGNTSGSNSSTNAPISNKVDHDSVWSTTEGDVDKIAYPEKHYPRDVKGGASMEESIVTEHTNLTVQDVKKGKRSKSYKKMFGWFKMGC
ncbi:hypothetical protein LIER_27075 [Lithospermum erythrorhizon]|uniref:Uncharacterized protein n=1 Tax=Lithospermum erythrorhizon TaxID=34254 RepID=A0AAV3RAT0_LITER